MSKICEANFGQALKATFTGGVWGAAGSFLAFASGGGPFLERLFKHSFSQAWLEGIRGGNMKHGLMAGLTSVAGGEAIMQYAGSAGKAIKVALDSVVAGTASELGGGKFANGAMTGAFAMLFNDLMHQREDAGGETSEPRDYTVELKRIAESADATLSEFTAFGPIPLRPISGYMLEPGGPSTTISGQDRRIPAGVYDVEPYSSTNFKNVYSISNGQVSADRKILIHSGNYHSNTLGCLLPGNSYSMVKGNYAVWNSGNALNQLRGLLGTNKATLSISDIGKGSSNFKFTIAGW